MYEYKVEKVFNRELEEKINAMAKEGWELDKILICNLVKKDSNFYVSSENLIFKRQK